MKILLSLIFLHITIIQLQAQDFDEKIKEIDIIVEERGLMKTISDNFYFVEDRNDTIFVSKTETELGIKVYYDSEKYAVHIIEFNKWSNYKDYERMLVYFKNSIPIYFEVIQTAYVRAYLCDGTEKSKKENNVCKFYILDIEKEKLKEVSDKYGCKNPLNDLNKILQYLSEHIKPH